MAKKIKKYKVGIDSETYAISLVDSPAIESDFIALKKEEEKVEVKLSDDAKHMLYGAVLIPDKDIYRCNHTKDTEISNTEQEFYINFTKESIEKMSQDFMKEYRQKEITLDHQEEASEVCVVESWLVADSYRDKANTLGLDVPVGTWMVGMKVNNIETWDRIKAGELRGFSVESLISLEDFNKIENNDTMEVNESFWSKLKNILFEALGKDKEEELKEEINEQKTEIIESELEEETPVEQPTETASEEPIVEEPTVEPPADEKPAEEQINEPTEEVKEEPKKEDNHLEDLINNLKAEIEALKEVNSGLQAKVKDLGKIPSTKPVSTNAKPNPTDTYSAWRAQMAEYLR